MALRERSPTLVIERGEGAEAATIELDGSALGASSIGIEVPLDPGPHQIAARASGFEPYMETIEVPEKETKRVTVTLKRIVDTSGRASNDGTKDHLQPTGPAPKPSRVVPYALGIGGGVLLVSSGVFYLMRQSQINTLNTLCGGPGECRADAPPDQVNHEKSKLNTYNALMTITGIGGVAAVGVAVGLLVLEPKPQKRQTTKNLYIHPAAPGANVAGFSLAGAF